MKESERRYQKGERMIPGRLVELRPVRAADLVLLRQWEHDPQIARWLGTTAAAIDAQESVEQEFDRLLRTARIKLLAIQTKDSVVVGFLRLHEVDLLARKAIVRLFIAPEMQGRGYGGDALRTLAGFCFEELGLHRLGLVVRAENVRAIALYQRLGFVIEGREREAVWGEGRWDDFVHMGVLAAEWPREEA